MKRDGSRQKKTSERGYNEPPSDVFSVVSDLSLRQHQMLPLNSDKRSAGQKPIQSKLTTFPVLADS